MFVLLVIKDDYKKLEVLAFEMETTIASLEEELASARAEKEQATSTIESLDVEMQSLSDKLMVSNSELVVYEEAVSTLVRICFLNILLCLCSKHSSSFYKGTY